jgi:hypothetical protein
MRIINVASLTLLTLTLCSSSIAEKAPFTVFVADELYAGCMISTIQTARISANKYAVQEYLKQADENCMLWMHLWYGQLMQDELPIANWPPIDVDIFEVRRKMLIMQIETKLNKIIKS